MGVGGGGAGVDELGVEVDESSLSGRGSWSDSSSASSSQESAGSFLVFFDAGLKESLDICSLRREDWRSLADACAMP